MKNCPNCGAKVDDNFDICWKCQYSFVDGKIFEDEDFAVICPSCGKEYMSSQVNCPGCGYNFEEYVPGKIEPPEGSRKLNCLRCETKLVFMGNYKFHEGMRVGAIGDIFEMFTNRESYDLYSCPKCGKVEFFMPG